jgi:hypothetical protein
MADTSAHGMNTILKIGTDDVSSWTKTSSLEVNPDVHDISGYGMRDKRKRGGQRDNTFSASGWYDLTATTGPGSVLKPKIGDTVSITRQIDGVGSTKPQDVFTAVVGKYVETAPCDDIVTWSCDFAIDGAVTSTAQTLAEDADTTEQDTTTGREQLV